MNIAGNIGNEESNSLSTDNENYLLMRAFSKVILSPWLRLKNDGTVIDSGNFNQFPLGTDFFSQALKAPAGTPDPHRPVSDAVQKAFETWQTQQLDYNYPDREQNRIFNIHILQSGADEVLIICSEPALDINHRVDDSLTSERLRTELKKHESKEKNHHYIFEFICKLHSETQLDEALSLVRRYGELIFPETSAEFLVVIPRTGKLENLTGWGEKVSRSLTVDKSQCPVFISRNILIEPALYCKAALQEDEDQAGYHLCLPVMSKDEIFGVLRLIWQNQNVYLGGEEFKQTACVFAEQISSFLEKMQLKQIIKNQSMKDPGSGLYNRKYFLEAMTREIHRVQRNEKTLSVLLIEAGNIQDIRRTYGVDVYQKLMVRFTKLLFRAVRISDLVCHYERDIFVISMAGMGREILQQRIKEIFLSLRNEKYSFEQDILSLNILIGAAIFPEHGKKIEDLLLVAEKALNYAGSSGHTGYVIAD